MPCKISNFYRGLYLTKALIPNDLGFYWLWAAIRFILVIIPQTGYIHPDEFFQSVEVFAGKPTIKISIQFGL